MLSADYHSIRAVSRGLIVDILQRSPHHAWHWSAWNPNTEQDEPTTAQETGQAAHALILEGRDIVAVIDAADYRTNAAKEARDEARSAGKVPMLKKNVPEFQLMCACAAAQIQVSLKLSLGGHGRAEQTILWTEQGQDAKARADWLSSDCRIILDLKITDIASPKAWIRSIASSGYDVQSAWYKRGVRAKFEVDARFIFCVVENTSPIYPVYFVELDPAWDAIGSAKIDLALKKWGACVEANEFPAYPQEIIRCDPPVWELAGAEELDAELHGFSKEAFLFGRVKNV